MHQPPTPSALPIIFILVLLSPLAIDVYLPAIPEMMLALNTSDNNMQLSISIFMMFMGVSQLFAGPLSDRFGRRFSALTGVAVYLAGAVLGAFASSIETLYISRALQGIGAACCSVTAFAWTREQFSAKEAGRWISYLSGVIAIIPTLAPMLGGVLTAQWGWESNFVFMSLVSVLLITGILFTMEKKVTQPTEHDNNEGSASVLIAFSDILSHKQFLIYALTGALTMAAILSYATHAPLIAMTQGGLDEYGFALLFGLIGLLQLAGGFIAPKIADRYSADMAIYTGIVLAIISAILLIALDGLNPLLFFAAVPIGCMGFCMIFGSAAGKAMEHFQHSAGSAASIDGFFRMAGGGVIAASLKLFGLSAFDTVALSFLLLVIPATLILLNTKTPTHPRHSDA